MPESLSTQNDFKQLEPKSFEVPKSIKPKKEKARNHQLSIRTFKNKKVVLTKLRENSSCSGANARSDHDKDEKPQNMQTIDINNGRNQMRDLNVTKSYSHFQKRLMMAQPGLNKVDIHIEKNNRKPGRKQSATFSKTMKYYNERYKAMNVITQQNRFSKHQDNILLNKVIMPLISSRQIKMQDQYQVSPKSDFKHKEKLLFGNQNKDLEGVFMQTEPSPVVKI